MNNYRLCFEGLAILFYCMYKIQYVILLVIYSILFNWSEWQNIWNYLGSTVLKVSKKIINKRNQIYDIYHPINRLVTKNLITIYLLPYTMCTSL